MQISGIERQDDKINKIQSSDISGSGWGNGKEFATDVARYHCKDKVWQE